MGVLTKAPGSVLYDQTLDWSDELASSETISANRQTVVPSGGLTLGGSNNSADASTVTYSGGIVGELYRVICEVDTNQSRTYQRVLMIRCQHRPAA